MNRTKIEWCDYTWNPVTGCQTGCWYCYARRMAQRFGGDFSPRFHGDRLDQPLRPRTPARIFVCSVADLFGPWVAREWQERILDVTRKAPQHTFIFLTKYPQRLRRCSWPQNCWIGATVNYPAASMTALREGETAIARAMADLSLCETPSVSFVSFEPLLGPPLLDMDLSRLDWIIVGALTGPGAKKYAPMPAWIEQIVAAADRAGVPAFLKNNLRPYWPGELRQEWPKEMA